MKNLLLRFTAVLLLGGAVCSSCRVGDTAKEKAEKPLRLVNVINFIRQTEPRISEITEDVLYQTVVEQVKLLNKYRLKGTYLLQYDALINPRYQELLKKELLPGSEVGGWWEITQPHVEAAGLKWRGRYSWDWHADVGFATGYTPEEREKLVDVYMEKFKEIFGNYPTAVGSWFIDAHTLAYMYDKYHIVASCNCKDQVGTDGYTLWGGYWGQAYYPSRKNAYMPAQTKEGQIAVPIFRMLGSDPIYQYDSGIGGEVQSVVSLEPVYQNGGGSQKWVEWFFQTMFEDPCLGFTYTQAGQENSFTWERMKKGLQIQMPLLAKLHEENKIRVETLSESGKWYKENFAVTPATAVSALSDHQQKGRQTVWYNSRYYRANLLWEGEQFRFRDIHLFDEAYPSDYLSTRGTSSQCIYTTLPLVDGCLWSSRNQLAGLRLKCRDASGQMVEAKTGTPSLTSKEPQLQVKFPLGDGKAAFLLTFDEDRICMRLDADKKMDWNLELTALPDADLPFISIEDTRIEAEQKGFRYHIICKGARFLDCREASADGVFQVIPAEEEVTLIFKN